MTPPEYDTWLDKVFSLIQKNLAKSIIKADGNKYSEIDELIILATINYDLCTKLKEEAEILITRAKTLNDMEMN